MDNFLPAVRSLLAERIHGCLITGAALAIELCEMDYNNVENLRKVLKCVCVCEWVRA